MFRETSTALSGLRCGVLVAATALLLVAMSPGAAHATCASSVSAADSFPDLPADAGGNGTVNAPEIASVGVSLNGSCSLTVDPVIDRPLTVDDGIFIYLDIDNNAATGDPTAEGADREVDIFVGTPPALWSWNAGSGGYDDFVAELPAVGSAGFSATLDQLGVPTSRPIGILVDSVYVDPIDGVPYIDWAPEPTSPAFRFSVSFSAPPPPPPPPPPPAPPAPPAPAAPAAPAAKQQAKKSGCVVPKVKRLSIAKARKKLEKAGCKYKVRGKGRVKSTSPRAGSRTTKTVIVRARQRARR
jgi:pyruvate/2-oxoglutarate dehydrogenase complex dihydrolipoamide acyltransferase (E2) component